MPYEGRSPYGDIFVIPTTAIDNIANRLYAEQRQRELQKQQDNKMLDEEFSRNIAGVKSADIGELTGAYNDFKQTHIGLQKRGRITPQDNMQLLLKKARVNEIINASKEDKERIKQYGLAVKGDTKRKYNTDAAGKITKWLNTPTSKRDFTKDEDELVYKYSFPDLTKIVNDAVGKGKEVKVPTGIKSVKGDLYDDKEVYSATNTPNQIYNSLYAGLGSRNDHDNFSRVVQNELTPEEINGLKTLYFAKINDPKYKAIYGEVQPFPESAGNTDLGKAVAIKTMQAVVATPLKPIRVDSEINKDRSMNKAADIAKERQRIGHQNSLENIRVAAGLRGNDPDTINRNVDGIIATHIANSKGLDGEVPMSAGTFKSLTGGELSRSTVVKVDDGGNYTYYKKDTDGSVIAGTEKTVPLAEAKAALTKGYKTGLSGNYNTGDKKIQTVKPTNIPTYKKADLIKAGWTEDQIKTAIKAAKIKIN